MELVWRVHGGRARGVDSGAYLPFALFNIASPALSVLYGFTGFKIVHTEPARNLEEHLEHR